MYQDICDDLVEFLNNPARAFSVEFVAEKKAQPTFELEQMTGIVVEVFPVADSRDPAIVGRGENNTLYQIGVVIRNRVADESETWAMIDLVDEVRNAIQGEKIFGDMAIAAMIEVPVYEPELLSQENLFAHVSTLAFNLLTEL